MASGSQEVQRSHWTIRRETMMGAVILAIVIIGAIGISVIISDEDYHRKMRRIANNIARLRRLK